VVTVPSACRDQIATTHFRRSHLHAPSISTPPTFAAHLSLHLPSPAHLPLHLPSLLTSHCTYLHLQHHTYSTTALSSSAPDGRAVPCTPHGWATHPHRKDRGCLMRPPCSPLPPGHTPPVRRTLSSSKATVGFICSHTAPCPEAKRAGPPRPPLAAAVAIFTA
jgi:hypothetical protein